MNAEQIIDAVRSLSYSQGFYGRLLMELRENGELLEELVEQNFGSVLDMVLYLEC